MSTPKSVNMVLGSSSKNWIHSSESLLNGKVTYVVKFIGKAEVPEPRGMPMVKMALQKLKFSRHIKRTEGAKPPKVELGINIHYISISDIKTREVLHSISLHRVSFCADDKQDKRLFAFIAKLDDDKHYCYGLDSIHQANDITLTIGQAFEIAYEKFLKENPSVAVNTKTSDMSNRVHELELENSELKKRIAELESGSTSETNAKKSPVTPQEEAKSTPQHHVPVGTSNIAIPRRNSPVVTSSRFHQKQEVINTTLNNDEVSPREHPSLLSCSSFFSSKLDNTHGASSPIPLSNHSNTEYKRTNLKQELSTRSPNLGASSTENWKKFGLVPESTPSRKFCESMQRNRMKKSQMTEDKTNKSKVSFFPSKLLNKKKTKVKEERKIEGAHYWEASSRSSCSSPSSSQYGNLDDVIATLQKMMNKNEQKPNHNGNAIISKSSSIHADVIGEKLATYHDANSNNYARARKPAPFISNKEFELTSRDEDFNQEIDGNINDQDIKSSYPEAISSSEDISSLSTISQESISAEHIYTLQPVSSIGMSYDHPRVTTSLAKKENQIATTTSGSVKFEGMDFGSIMGSCYESNTEPHAFLHHSAESGKSACMTEDRNMSEKDDLSNTLHLLSGEEGYMTLSGCRQVRSTLCKYNPMFDSTQTSAEETCFDSTYDNVNKLMEAVREAAARDASKEGRDVKRELTGHLKKSNIPPKPMIVSKQSNPPISKIWNISNDNSNRPPSTATVSTDYGSYGMTSEDRFAIPVFDTYSDSNPNMLKYVQQDPQSLQRVDALPALIPSTLFKSQPIQHTDQRLLSRKKWEVSPETDITHSRTMSESKYQNKDAFNMQPFAPPISTTRFPQPPSNKKLQKAQDNIWSGVDLFDPFHSPKHFSQNVQDMQSTLHSSTSGQRDESIQMFYPRSKKSNYHIVSHPLIRKKKNISNNLTALKWNKKYFPSGKKKSSAVSKRKAKLSTETIFQEGSSKGLAISEEDMSLDSFDPLKH